MVAAKPVVLGVLAMAMLASAGPWGAAGQAGPCAGQPVVTLEGIGPACREGALWRLLLPNGGSVLTHGPDPVPSPEAFGLDAEVPWSSGTIVPVACQTPDQPAPVAYNNVLVYARPFDKPDRYAQMAPEIQLMAAQANTLFFRETLARYRFLCDSPLGPPVVRNAILPTPLANTHPGTIFGDLQVLGYTDGHEKYWVWYDGYECPCGGLGTIDVDSSPSLGNRNNFGPDWAVTFGITGFWGWFVMMHESGHNLGAVQLDTPQASGGFHCNDGWDVMCYADGGPTSNYVPDACAPTLDGLPRWDCNRDDYAGFPPLSEYLATHWNVASPLNRFITRAG